MDDVGHGIKFGAPVSSSIRLQISHLSRTSEAESSHTPFFNNTNIIPTQALYRSLVPLGDRILVQRAPKVAQTSSGLYLPTDKTKAPNEGTVIAVGPGQTDVTGTLHPTTLKKGDTVLLPEYGGTKVDIDGSSEAEGEMFLFRESDILGKYE